RCRALDGLLPPWGEGRDEGLEAARGLSELNNSRRLPRHRRAFVLLRLAVAGPAVEADRIDGAAAAMACHAKDRRDVGVERGFQGIERHDRVVLGLRLLEARAVDDDGLGVAALQLHRR